MSGFIWDEFQQEIYSAGDLDLEAIGRINTRLMLEWGYDVESNKPTYDFLYIHHNIDYPLYYISYAMSAFPVLELWLQAKEDYDAACDTYLKYIEKGMELPYKELLKEMGLRTVFEDGYIRELAYRLSERVSN